MKPGSVFIDMSSINPVASKEIATALAQKRIEMLDAPVSGGEPKAIDGTLRFLVGGKQEIFDAYKPLLLHMGRRLPAAAKLAQAIPPSRPTSRGIPVGKCLEPIGALKNSEREALRKVLVEMDLL